MEEFKELLFSKIKEKVNPTVFTVWFSDLDFSLENGVLEIKSPNQFKSNVVKNEFFDMLKGIIGEVLSQNIELRFIY